MRCGKKTVRHYWKRVEKTWEQPVLTSNTSSSLLSTSATHYSSDSTAPWKVYDNDSSTRWNTSNYQTNDTHTSTFDRTLRITKVVVVGRRSDNNWMIKTATINGITKTFTSSAMTQTFEFDEPYETNVMDVACTGNGWIGIFEIQITATYIDIEAGTESDYDYYTDDEVAILPKISDKFYGINL